MIGKWNNWYSNLSHPEPYGDVTTYHVGEDFLCGLAVEDWGCGKGYFSTIHSGGYTGIDGSFTPYSDVTADLTEYVSDTDGLFMRHVIEHNTGWDKVLANALQSFHRTMVLVLFTPMSDTTHQIAWNDIGVPDISFSHDDLVTKMAGMKYTYRDFKTNTQYGTERVYVIEK